MNVMAPYDPPLGNALMDYGFLSKGVSDAHSVSIRIESDKTTSIYNVSTRVLGKK